MMEHIKELIELQYHIEIDNKKFIILDDEEKLSESIEKIAEDGKLFLSSGMFLSRKDQKALEDKNIEVIEIPEYYFRNELRNVGEI